MFWPERVRTAGSRVVAVAVMAEFGGVGAAVKEVVTSRIWAFRVLVIVVVTILVFLLVVGDLR